jgi:hypothetical protein
VIKSLALALARPRRAATGSRHPLIRPYMAGMTTGVRTVREATLRSRAWRCAASFPAAASSARSERARRVLTRHRFALGSEPRRSLGFAFTFDKPADFIWGRKDRVRSVTHHPGRYERGRPWIRPFLTAVYHEPEIAFPELARMAVGRGHAKRVAN